MIEEQKTNKDDVHSQVVEKAANGASEPQPPPQKVTDSARMNSLSQPSLRVQLRWENITVIPKDQAKNTSVVPKKILDNICGTVMPEQFLAIIGASGNS